jgi:autotransporter-associated beta strand protein
MNLNFPPFCGLSPVAASSPKKLTLALAALALVGSVLPGGAANVWDGGTGANNNRWDTVLNWDNDVLPLDTADVTIGTGAASGNQINLNGNRVVNSLTFTGGYYQLVGGALTVSSGNVTVDSGSVGNQYFNLSSLILGNSGVFNIASGKQLNFNNAITDGGLSYGITKTGAGTLALNSASTFGGGINHQEGILYLANNAALGTGQLSITGTAAATVSFGTTQIANDIVINRTGSTNNVTFSGAPTQGVNNNFTTQLGKITADFGTDNAHLIFAGGPRTWIFSDTVSLTNMDYWGLLLNADSVGHYSYVFSSAPTITSSQINRILMYTSTGNKNLLVSEAVNFGNQIDVTMSATSANTVGGIHTSGTVNFNSTGTLNLSGNGTANLTSLHSAAITEFSTQITDGATTAAVNINAGYQQVNAALSANLTAPVYETINPLGVVKFSRAAGNTYDGGTTVHAGTLLVMNTSGSATGTGAVTVNSSARLGGTGYISGAVTAAGATSTFAPGDLNAIGTLHLSGGLVANAGATFNFDLNGVSADSIDFGAGAVTLNGVITFNFSSLGTIQTGTTYSLFAGSGTWSGAPTFVFNNPGGYVLDTTYGGGNGYIWDAANHSLTVQFGAVPEPQTMALAVIGGCFLLWRSRKLRRI